jgi:hypothetical protein
MAWPYATLLGSLVIGVLLCGCAPSPGREADARPYLREVCVMLPYDPLFGADLEVGLYVQAEARSELLRTYWFRHGERYGLTQMCKEISRATGRRIVWLPESGEELLKLDYNRRGDISFPRLCMERRGGYAKAEIGDVLSYALAVLGETPCVGVGSSEPGIWTAWLSRDAIYFVLLPRLGPGGVTTGKAREFAGMREDGEHCRGLFTSTIVLPSADWNSPAVVEPALMSPDELVTFFRQPLELQEGKYRYSDLARAVERLMHRSIMWLPRPEWKLWAPKNIDDMPDRELMKPAVPGFPDVGFTVGWALRELITEATEAGLGYESPDREVWAALPVGSKVYFLAFPRRISSASMEF